MITMNDSTVHWFTKERCIIYVTCIWMDTGMKEKANYKMHKMDIKLFPCHFVEPGCPNFLNQRATALLLTVKSASVPLHIVKSMHFTAVKL